MSGFSETLAHAELLEALSPAMHEAGELIEKIRESGVVGRMKADKSLVSEADEAAERLLEAAIRRVDPYADIVGEEAVAAGASHSTAGRFWLIDPLDGTNGFLRGKSEYSVNIGLVEDGVPTLGLVLHPPTGDFWTGAITLGAWKETRSRGRHAIRTRAWHQPPIISTSSDHPDVRTRQWMALHPNADIRPLASSLKLCVVAEGSSDLYPRHGPTNEWDTAAGDAILRAAGGTMIGTDGKTFLYGKPLHSNGNFLAVGDPLVIADLPPFTD